MVNLRRAIEASKPEIEAAIRKAEMGTSGEIVVVISKVAGTYGRQEGVISFLTSIGLLSVLWWQLQGVVPGGQWDTGPVVRFGLVWVILSLIVGFMLGQLLVRIFPKMLRAFASQASLRRQAERAAALAFRRYRVSQTNRETGVMIFLAEMEQAVVVMGDDKISDCINQHEWEAVRDSILSGIQGNNPAAGLKEAILKAGELLRLHVPCDGKIENELADRLYFQ